MGNGVLAFTLGLEGGKFLSVASQAEKGIAGIVSQAIKLTGVGALVGTAFESLKGSANIIKGVFAAFERGAALDQLHRRTGESVGDLFLLQKGFKGAGMESDDLGQMLFHLQKAMTGVSDIGEDTHAAFARLGLSMSVIRNMRAPEQFEALAAAMRKLDVNTAAGVAGKLFGREGASNFLELARSGQAFADAMKDNAAAADQMERNASAFEKIEISLGKLRSKGNNFFAGIAEGAAPGIQRVLDMLNKFDLSGLGKKIGNVFAVIAQSIADHNLGELLKLSLNAGLEGFKNYFMAILTGIGAAMDRIFNNLPQLGHSLSQVIGGAINAGLTGNSADYDQYLRGKKSLSNPGAGAADAFEKLFKDTLKDSDTSAARAFADFFASTLAKVPQALADTTNGKSPPGTLFPKPWGATSVEKMGFQFNSSGPSILSDHARETAANTRLIAHNTSILVGRIDPATSPKPPSFGHSTSAR